VAAELETNKKNANRKQTQQKGNSPESGKGRQGSNGQWVAG